MRRQPRSPQRRRRCMGRHRSRLGVTRGLRRGNAVISGPCCDIRDDFAWRFGAGASVSDGGPEGAGTGADVPYDYAIFRGSVRDDRSDVRTPRWMATSAVYCRPWPSLAPPG